MAGQPRSLDLYFSKNHKPILLILLYSYQKSTLVLHMTQLDCIEEFHKKLFWRKELIGYKKHPDLIVEYILIYVAINFKLY